MKIICRPRRYGKTKELITLAAKEEYGVVVCHSKQGATIALKMALELFKDKEIEGTLPKFISYEQFLSGELSGRRVSKVFIDDAEVFLQYVASPIEIGAISLTNGE